MPQRYRKSLRDRESILNNLDPNITPMCPIPSSRLDSNNSNQQEHLSFDKTFNFEEEQNTPMLPEVSRDDAELPTPKIERYSECTDKGEGNTKIIENETSRWTDNSETLTRLTHGDASITRCSTFSSDIDKNIKLSNKPPAIPNNNDFNSNRQNSRWMEKLNYGKGVSPVCGESPMTNRSFWEDPFNTSANLPIDDQITKQFEKFSSQENLVDVTDEEEQQ